MAIMTHTEAVKSLGTLLELADSGHIVVSKCVHSDLGDTWHQVTIYYKTDFTSSPLKDGLLEEALAVYRS
jgi:predicted metal-dependent RNase